jgi:hypothetical protein
MQTAILNDCCKVKASADIDDFGALLQNLNVACVQKEEEPMCRK